MFNKGIILSNYKNKDILYDYLEFIHVRYDDLNEINNIFFSTSIGH